MNRCVFVRESKKLDVPRTGGDEPVLMELSGKNGDVPRTGGDEPPE